MQLTFDWFDGRTSRIRAVIDKLNRDEVGHINTCRSSGISISLFGGRYEAEVHSYDECVGFIKGVEAVLNHLDDYMVCS
jgi:hypothetical protein